MTDSPSYDAKHRCDKLLYSASKIRTSRESMSQVLSLSERFRPKTIEQFLGQERWLQKNGVILRSIERGRPHQFTLLGASRMWEDLVGWSVSFLFLLSPCRFSSHQVSGVRGETGVGRGGCLSLASSDSLLDR